MEMGYMSCCFFKQTNGEQLYLDVQRLNLHVQINGTVTFISIPPNSQVMR
jgi:hypothetical protein